MATKLTKLEAGVLLGMLGDVDPAHFEAWKGRERAKYEMAYERAENKLLEIYHRPHKGDT